MKLDVYKDITPVFFNDSSIKITPYTVEPFEDCFPLHWHERMEFIYVIKGTLKISVNDVWAEFTRGDTAIISPRQLHQGEALENGATYFCITFEPMLLINGTPSTEKYIKPIVNNNIVFNCKSNNKEIVDILLKIITLSEQKFVADSIEMQALVYTLIGLLYRNLSVMKKLNNTSDDKFDTVVKYINSHFADIVNTGTLSKSFGYAESYFCRKFKSTTGLSVIKYIKILRLEHAQHLLKNTAENINKIANSCGFSDHCYFTRSFREYFGYTPSEYREKSLNARDKTDT